MLNGQLDQQQIVDDWKRQHRRIQEGNQKKSRRAKSARKRHDFLFPSVQPRCQKEFLPFVCSNLSVWGIGSRRRRQMSARGYCAKAARSKGFMQTFMRAVRCRLGRLGISPMRRMWPN